MIRVAAVTVSTVAAIVFGLAVTAVWHGVQAVRTFDPAKFYE